MSLGILSSLLFFFVFVSLVHAPGLVWGGMLALWFGYLGGEFSLVFIGAKGGFHLH